MSEQASGSHPSRRRVDADVIPLPVHEIRAFQGTTYGTDGTARLERTEIWDELDATLSKDEVASVVESLNIGKLMIGVDNIDRPVALTEWILCQSHLTPDYKDPLIRESERSRLQAQLKSKSTHAAVKDATREQLEKLKPLTSYEVTKVERGSEVVAELAAVVKQLETIREQEGNMGLISKLDDIEKELEPVIKNSNVIRIYNALHDKLRLRDRNVPSPDLIIAGRILLMFLYQRVTPDSTPQS